MKKYEYKVEQIFGGISLCESDLNTYGEEGWMFISFYREDGNLFAVFYREI